MPAANDANRNQIFGFGSTNQWYDSSASNINPVLLNPIKNPNKFSSKVLFRERERALTSGLCYGPYDLSSRIRVRGICTDEITHLSPSHVNVSRFSYKASRPRKRAAGATSCFKIAVSVSVGATGHLSIRRGKIS